LVFRRCHSAQLIPFYSLRQELELRLELTIRTSLDRSSSDCVLHHYLDDRACFLQPAKQISSLDSTHLCDGFRCSSMGTNALEYFVIWSVAAMVYRWPIGKCSPWQSTMALAWTPRFTSKYWARHDTFANFDQSSFCRYNNDGPTFRHTGHDIGEGHGTHKEWSWRRVPGLFGGR